ncbi:unnamed protein product [Acanthoscelides obtectus]|uniref:NADH-ubiquinone oxidoreductase chain 1 n=2 Tax=Acanthoscelides obtectus TaxID=200917 RepID=A0A9P0QDJ0_ACAOB|nr:unnamed protein product [Acanthoscelides obtectus]CAH2017703.1 unnamed protein product [Acanthoscelides obtectus]CAH2021185.1 unnamed protein product [Acanthoscelides obtectus]CAK1682720.1 NADH-ubiquinone oxidoreductase chain 1 [Acanthoscelides obtectus]CAK1682721.1 NADH-ubiquinone oxidoreductase chain 1 [Acanthoscelides obtectus]
MPFFSVNLRFNLSILFFLRVSRLGVYTVILAGWASNSNYALLGSLRAVAQTISLAETNRTPFDFAEGESELVSGFNVEYRRGGFAMIFLAEYSRILFISILCCILFLGGDIFTIIFFLKLVFISFF